MNGEIGMKTLIEMIDSARDLAEKSGYKQLHAQLNDMYCYASGLYSGLLYYGLPVKGDTNAEN